MAGEHVQFLTTHAGSLPRTAALVAMLADRDHGAQVSRFSECVARAVAEAVDRQLAAGLDIVNDGEAGKISYATYAADRLDGFERAAPAPLPLPRDAEDFSEFFARVPRAAIARPECIGPIAYRGLESLRADLATLQAVLLEADSGVDAFMTSASPGIIAWYLPNRHYRSHEEYVWALADAMKPEYDAIHNAGFILQLDCPDLANAQNAAHLETHIEAINEATRDIPPERMRLHLCWGNYEGPHTCDTQLSDIIDAVLAARPSGLSFEAANPRHAHEWRVFDETDLPEDKILIPGVIDSTTNYVEHPQLVADRIVRYASIVGPDRVIAGTDCGFATTASHVFIDPAIAWAKLRSLSDGARLASLEAGRGLGRTRR